MVREASIGAKLLDSEAKGTLYLASRSPRRRRLLEEARIEHVVQESGLDDGLLRPGSVQASHWVAAMAYLKAVGAGARLDDKTGAVLGADTVCAMDGLLFGQPRSEAEARGMIRGFEGRSHEVLTGVALVAPGRAPKRLIFVDRATVRMGRLGRDAIDAYVDTGLWRGKAGAYNLEERLEAGWPIEVDGDPTAVVGLPMRRLAPLLFRMGFGRARAGGRAA